MPVPAAGEDEHMKNGVTMGVDFGRLRTAVDWSMRQLDTPRKKRLDAIRQYVGAHYADGGSDKRVPTNFLELAVTIYTQQLAARAPRALISTSDSSLRPFARNMEIAVNQIPDEIDLGGTLRRAVVEALFSFAVVKAGLCDSGEEVLGHQYGKMFADIVSIDDYFCDMSAKSRDAIQFEGNDYWVTLDAARSMYNDGPATDITPDEHTVTADQGGARAESVGANSGADLYKDMVWLRDVWLVRERKMVTYGVKSLKIFGVSAWEGPVKGPYHMLGFSDVPGNLLPLPPMALWRDLHELGNSLFRKLGRQADSKKTVAAFQGGNDDDVQALKKASDGEGIRYSGQKPDAITVGGIDAPTLAFYIQIRDLFSYFAGNIDSMGGLAPMTQTVGQDKLLTESATARMSAMRGVTIDFARGIFGDLAWYEWTDPVRARVISKPVKGTDISVRSAWSADTRRGRFEDYDFDIDVYSMQDDTPTIKLQKIGMAMKEYVLPALPSIEAQGGQVDFKSLLAIVAKLGNIPEIEDIVKFVDPSTIQPPAAGAAGPARMPASTTRTYERVNRPGATRQGKDDVMSRLLMGGRVQPAEGAAIGRKA